MAIQRRPSNVKRAPLVRPKLNGMLMYDMQNGRMVLGKDGRWYLNGGLSFLNAFGGRGNTWKSTIQRTLHMHAHARYGMVDGFYENMDSEFSVDPRRTTDLMRNFDPVEYFNFYDELCAGEESSVNVTDNSVQTGDEWWENLNNDLEVRAVKSNAKDLKMTPMLDYNGSFVGILPVWHFDLDSCSQLSMASTIKQQNKGAAGSAEQQTVWMRDAGAKAQMITQMSLQLPRGGAYLSMTAHLDDSIKLDQYAPSTKKLAGLKGELKFKGVPGRQFTFLPSSCYVATSTGNMLDRNKEPEFGNSVRDSLKGDFDMQMVRYEQLRGKGGATGQTLDIIYSQQEGMKEHLSMFFRLLRLLGGFGMTIQGNNMSYTLDLYPDLRLTRNTVDDAIRTDRRLRRAIEITYMLSHERYEWHAEPEEYKMEPGVLRTLIEQKGYDWNDIFDNSVYWWFFNDDPRFHGPTKENPDARRIYTITHRTLIDMATGKHEAVYLSSYPGNSDGTTGKNS